MSGILIVMLTAFLLVLVFGVPAEGTREGRVRGRHRIQPLRPAAVRMHLADGTVDDAPLENGSRWILVRDEARARTVST